MKTVEAAVRGTLVRTFLIFCAAGVLAPAARAYDSISMAGNFPLKKLVEKPAAALGTRSGRIVVADAGQDRLAVFSAQGKWEANWAARGKGPGQLSRPLGLAEDADGRVYAAD